jgi:hypothetical protein
LECQPDERAGPRCQCVCAGVAARLNWTRFKYYLTCSPMNTSNMTQPTPPESVQPSLWHRVWAPLTAALIIYFGVKYWGAPQIGTGKTWVLTDQLRLVSVAALVFLLFLYRECQQMGEGLVRSLVSIAKVFWKVFCFAVIPLVFGTLCFFSMTKNPDFQISVLQIVLAGLEVSPWLLNYWPPTSLSLILA